MQITTFVRKDAIIPQLAATTRDEAITELVKVLQSTGAFAVGYTGDVLAAVLRREQLGSTGIGRGIAIPHSRHSSVVQLAGALGLVKHPGGLGFEALDGESVDVLVLMISPQDQPGLHLRALDCVVQTFKEDSSLAALRTCTTAEQIWDFLQSRGLE